MNKRFRKGCADGCTGITRRTFLADVGMGFTGLALSAILFRDGIARAADPQTLWTPPDGKPQFPPKAKSVIWLFMMGGVSHLEGFDPKETINKYAGLTLPQTPYADALKSKYFQNGIPNFNVGSSFPILGLQAGYQKDKKCGIAVSDWWPHTRECMEDIAVVRSLYTEDNAHTAQFEFHAGKKLATGACPTIGSWIHYGLGTLNENLPQFVVLGRGMVSIAPNDIAHGADYLGPEHAGITLDTGGPPLAHVHPEFPLTAEEQRAQFDLIRDLDQSREIEYPHDEILRARIKSYELAYKMQASVPEAMNFAQESNETRALYGLDNPATKVMAERCLAARRLVERGVRFVQIYHGGGNVACGDWDSHTDLLGNHTKLCGAVDQPIAGLLKDLKQRGMLNDTLVVWASEFGRSAGSEPKKNNEPYKPGRQHSPFGFSCWMAGGGIKGGVVHGATDEIGFHAAVDRHYVTDIHATIFHQLGLDPRKLEIPGHRRLDIEVGHPIKEIIA